MGQESSALGVDPSLYEFPLYQYALKTKLNAALAVWNNKYKPSDQLLEYRIAVSKQHELSRIYELFMFRYEHRYLVSTLYLTCQQQGIKGCGQIYKGSIYYQQPIAKLSQIKDIPFLDTLHMYAVAFNGFEILYKKYGYFDIFEDMFHICENGKLKVWCNSAPHKLQPQQYLLDSTGKEEDMIHRILYIIDQNSDHSQTRNIKREFHHKINIGRRICYSFDNARDIFRDICRENNWQPTQRLNCIASFTKDDIENLLQIQNGNQDNLMYTFGEADKDRDKDSHTNFSINQQLDNSTIRKKHNLNMVNMASNLNVNKEKMNLIPTSKNIYVGDVRKLGGHHKVQNVGHNQQNYRINQPRIIQKQQPAHRFQRHQMNNIPAPYTRPNLNVNPNPHHIPYSNSIPYSNCNFHHKSSQQLHQNYRPVTLPPAKVYPVFSPSLPHHHDKYPQRHFQNQMINLNISNQKLQNLNFFESKRPLSLQNRDKALKTQVSPSSNNNRQYSLNKLQQAKRVQSRPTSVISHSNQIPSTPKQNPASNYYKNSTKETALKKISRVSFLPAFKSRIQYNNSNNSNNNNTSNQAKNNINNIQQTKETLISNKVVFQDVDSHRFYDYHISQRKFVEQFDNNAKNAEQLSFRSPVKDIEEPYENYEIRVKQPQPMTHHQYTDPKLLSILSSSYRNKYTQTNVKQGNKAQEEHQKYINNQAENKEFLKGIQFQRYKKRTKMIESFNWGSQNLNKVNLEEYEHEKSPKQYCPELDQQIWRDLQTLKNNGKYK